MAADTSTLYCTISPISFSDFTPSRTTRVSSNPVLQEHSVVDSLCKKRKASTSSLATCTSVMKPRRGRYVQVEFVALLKKKDDSIRNHSLSDPTGTSHALHLRSRIDPARKAVRLRNANCDRKSRAATCTKTQLRPTVTQRWPTLMAKMRYSPPSSPPPPPPPGILSRSTPSLDRLLLDSPTSGGLRYGVRPIETSQFLSSQVSLELSEDGAAARNAGRQSGGSCAVTVKRRPLPSADSSCTSSPPFSPQRGDSLSSLESPLHTGRCDADSAAIDAVVVVAASTSPQKRCERRPSFVELEPGAADGYTRCHADYMGCKVVNEYADRVDECALHLINGRPTDVAVYVTARKVYVAERGCDVLVASFDVRDILHVSRCSKNRWIIGITTWRFRSTPECRIFKCGDSIAATSLYDAVRSQLQNLEDATACETGATLASQAPRWAQCPASSSQLESRGNSKAHPCTDSASHHNPHSDAKMFQKFQAAYIGSAVAGKTHSVHELVDKVLKEHQPSQARESLLWLGGGQLRLTDLAEDPETAFSVHDLMRIRAIGVYAVDKRFIGYITKDEGKPLMGHVLHCCTTSLMLTFLSELRQACEAQFQSRGGSLYEELSIDDCEGTKVPAEIEEQSQEQMGHSGLLRRLKTLTLSQRSHHVHSIKEQAKFYTPATDSSSSSPEHLAKKKEEGAGIPSGSGLTEEDYALFTVTYMGSANTEPPFTQQAILDTMDLFRTHGVAAGQATVTKNSVSMQVAALGITLSDQSRLLFVTRNYPRNQVAGYCLHPNLPEYFAFATRRPGLETLRCHVFKQLDQPCKQIVGAMKFWLEMKSE